MAPLPCTVQIVEMNRQAAAEAFSGHAPRTMLALAVGIAFATVGALVAIRLHDLDLLLAERLV